MKQLLNFAFLILICFSVVNTIKPASLSEIQSICQQFKNDYQKGTYLCYWGEESKAHGYFSLIQNQNDSDPAVLRLTSRNEKKSLHQLKPMILKGNIELCSTIKDRLNKVQCIEDKTDEAFPDYYVTILSAKANTLQVVVKDIEKANTILVANYDGYDYYAFLL